MKLLLLSYSGEFAEGIFLPNPKQESGFFSLAFPSVSEGKRGGGCHGRKERPCDVTVPPECRSAGTMSVLRMGARNGIPIPFPVRVRFRLSAGLAGKKPTAQESGCSGKACEHFPVFRTMDPRLVSASGLLGDPVRRCLRFQDRNGYQQGRI